MQTTKNHLKSPSNIKKNMLCLKGRFQQKDRLTPNLLIILQSKAQGLFSVFTCLQSCQSDNQCLPDTNLFLSDRVSVRWDRFTSYTVCHCCC